MPRAPRAARRGSQSRGKRNTPARARACADADVSLVEDFLPVLEVALQRGSSGRGSRTQRKRNPPPSRPRASADTDLIVDLVCIGEEQHQLISEAAPQCRSSGRRRSQRRRATRPRAAVVNLDVTYSSDDSEGGAVSDGSVSSAEKSPKSRLNLLLTPSPKHNGCTSDDDAVEEVTTYVPQDNKFDSFLNSDSDEDLFSCDYKVQREKALTTALKEIKKLDKKPPTRIDQSDDCMAISDSPVLGLDMESPDQNLLNLNVSLTSPVKVDKSKLIKRSKKMTKAQKDLKEVDETMSLNQSTNDITIVSDDEECENSSIMLLIKWESSYIRWPLRKFQKFSSVYQEIADRFNLDVAQVLLCHSDKVISPDKCPKDLNLNIGDIIEGGIQSKASVNGKGVVTTHSSDSIPLKIQNSEKKGTVTIYINRQDKMIELMHRYAEEKHVKLENLRFSFDGEKLDPGDTPETLDLEGNECIDVFTK